MTISTEDAQAAEADARLAVDEAEADILSGRRDVSAAKLNKVRDTWRHASLATQRSLKQLQQDNREKRLAGLAEIGGQVDKLAEPEHAERLAEALRDITAACDRFHAIAEAHDLDVRELVDAARDLGAESAAPGGPRETSGYVAVTGDGITHRRVTVRPLGNRVVAAIGHAVSGDIERAVAEVRAAATAPEPRRPDYLLRNERSGNLIPIYGPLNEGMRAQLKRVNPRGGELAELADHDVDKYMRGELA